jgi:hypothetical protein
MTFYYFINHIIKDKNIDIYKQISLLHNYINREKNSVRFSNNPILANEIIYISNKLNKFYESKYLFRNNKNIYNELSYLQLVCESYFLEEHPVYLLNKLIKTPIKYKSHIIRLLTYNAFDEFITLNSYMKMSDTDFNRENNHNNYTKNMSYQIYLININNTIFNSFFIV